MFDPSTHGFTPIDTAKKCFAENLRLYGNDAEKYNLYNGLAKQAEAIEQMQGDITILREQMNAIIKHLAQRG